MSELDKKSQYNIISVLTKDLSNVNIKHVYELLDKNNWYTVSKILGYDISEYENLQLAGRMIIYDLKEKIGNSFKEYTIRMKDRLKPKILEYMIDHVHQLQELYDEQNLNDNEYDWFSANSLMRTYLTKNGKDGDVIETPCQMKLRIATTLYYKKGLNEIKIAFNDMCNGYYIPASPTIFNSGMKVGQMSSCFLVTVEDSLDSILKIAYDIGFISKNNGAVGVDISRIRHSRIGLDGKSDGIVPFIYLYNSLIRAVNQNGKRKGAATMFCRPHHIDIYEFCEMSLKTGDHYQRAHDLNFAIWFPWLFWKRVRENGEWNLFCPAETKLLNDIWGKEWSTQYEIYESNMNIPRKNVMARDLLKHIVSIQRKTGMPYIMHADSINMKSNQKNLGMIRSANLCLEICEYSSDEEIPSCNLSSISLRAFVNNKINDNNTIADCYNFNKLGLITRRITTNLNQVIEENTYSSPKIELSNNRHRPIGIGVSGFAEMLHELDLPFESYIDGKYKLNPITKKLNKLVFACMYWNALAQSVELAIERGKYESFEGSPISKGKFQFDLWREETELLDENGYLDKSIRSLNDDIPVEPYEWNQKSFKLSNEDIIEPTWEDLRRCIMKYGIRNSLLIALMPTATSSQPLRNGETVEAHQSNIYSRKVLNGAYPVVNRYLVKDLQELELWNRNTIDLIQADTGSISKIKLYVKNNLDIYNNFNNKQESWDRLDVIVDKYKTMWELSMKTFLTMAADRGRYVCQSQSTNIYLQDPSDEQLIAIHGLTNSLGLKTGMYYLREGAAIQPIKFTVDPTIISFVTAINSEAETEKDKDQDLIYEKTPIEKLYGGTIPDNVLSKLNGEGVNDKLDEIYGRLKETKKNKKKEFICTDDVCLSCQ